MDCSNFIDNLKLSVNYGSYYFLHLGDNYMNETFIYDVALSFAGEDRKYVEEVASFLKKNKIAVFYDYFEEENLWGKNLISYL